MNPILRLAWSTAALAAALLPAQNPAAEALQRELAQLAAVEAQERDLGKAEAGYRALLARDLPAELRGEVQRRLGGLLERLGRAEEAKALLAAAGGATAGFDDFTARPPAQDPARAAALREQARQVVQRILAQQEPFVATAIPGIGEVAAADELLWLGAAAVPEVAAALAGEQAGVWNQGSGSSARGGAVYGLAMFLWRIGGEAAGRHLVELARTGTPPFRGMLYGAARAAQDPAMLALVLRLAREETDDALLGRLLAIDHPAHLLLRLPLGDLVDLVVAKGPALQKVMLPKLAGSEFAGRFDAPALAKLHEVVRSALASSDPALGHAAHQFLLGEVSCATPVGMELLLQELPQMRGAQAAPRSFAIPAEWLADGAERQLRLESARHLWPRLVAAAQALGPSHPAAPWLVSWLALAAQPLDAAIVPDVLALLPSLPNQPTTEPARMLAGKIDASSALALLPTYDQLPHYRQSVLMLWDSVAQLPAELFAPLRERMLAESKPASSERWTFLRILAKTRDVRLVDDVLAAFRAEPEKRADDAVRLLVGLGRHHPGGPVAAALRDLLARAEVEGEERARVLLVLLAMRDPAAVAALATAEPKAVRHPYATKPPHPSSPGLSPHAYFLNRDPDPPHGFTPDEVAAAVAGWPRLDVFRPNQWPGVPLDDRVLLVIASRFMRNSPDGDGVQWWVEAVLRRQAVAEASPRLRELVAAWLGQGSPDEARRVALGLRSEEVAPFRDALQQRVVAADERTAAAAFEALDRAGLCPEPAVLVTAAAPLMRERAARRGDPALLRGLLTDPSPLVRQAAAQRLGAAVDREAVPALLTLLRDPETAAAATEALTRIRFYHEQQAHWDRVLRGLDASPASAAEKLLLQAKPSAPKAQRLLALASLGVLGAPEALPFLIDWVADADPEVAAAAREAIGRIHQNPRR